MLWALLFGCGGSHDYCGKGGLDSLVVMSASDLAVSGGRVKPTDANVPSAHGAMACIELLTDN